MRANKIAMFFYICTLDATITLEAFPDNLQKTYKKLTTRTKNLQFTHKTHKKYNSMTI